MVFCRFVAVAHQHIMATILPHLIICYHLVVLFMKLVWLFIDLILYHIYV